MTRSFGRGLSLAAASSLLLMTLACDGDEPQVEQPKCGDGVVDGTETCDGDQSIQTTCRAEGFTGGTVSCSDTCEIDLTTCEFDPCVGFYPCEQPGIRIGDVIADLSFTTGNAAAYDLGAEDDALDLHDLFQNNVANGGELKGALIFLGAGWCPYCSQQAQTLEALYQEFKDQGIIVIGAVLQNTRGQPATADYASRYADDYGWTFPAVAAPDFPIEYWPAGENRGSVPFNLFLDLETMRIYGRSTGALDPKLLRYFFQDLADDVEWTEDNERMPAGQCAAEPTTELEPNDLSGSPEDAQTLPFTLTGAICEPRIVDGIVLDEDTVDLGVLPAGTLLDVSMRQEGESRLSPVLIAMRSAGVRIDWYQLSPTAFDGGPTSRQWLIDTEAQFFLSATDGRVLSHLHYGNRIPDEQSCCEGGPDYRYTLDIAAATLAATENPLTVGNVRTASLTPEALQVYPFEATAGTSYTFEMLSSVGGSLDPYLILWDPAASQVLASNDDNPAGGFGALIEWTPETDQTDWVVASYVIAFTVDGAPAYELEVR